MRAAPALAAAVALALAGPPALPARMLDAADARRLRVDDEAGLEAQLLELARARLAPAGLSIDEARVQWRMPAPVAPGPYVARALWDAAAAQPALPLAFELRPEAAGAPALRVFAAVALAREAAVATHGLRKGSIVRCDDLAVRRLPARQVPRHALALPCALPDTAVALRDIGADQALRADDVGPPFDLVAGAPVTIAVTAGGVRVDAEAVALADARLGQAADVRLGHPPRTLKAFVVAPGTVQLLEPSP